MSVHDLCPGYPPVRFHECPNKQSKGKRAAKAVAAHPEKSDRALAAEIGVDHKTVAKARQSTGDDSPVEKRTGRDGKVRRMPERKQASRDDLMAQTNEFHRELFRFWQSYRKRLIKWSDKNPGLEREARDTLLRALWLCADEFNQLAQQLDGR